MQAIDVAASVRMHTSPNPWVGCVIVTTDGQAFTGATETPGGRHAEIVALDAARLANAQLQGATVYTTLEPCHHQGRGYRRVSLAEDFRVAIRTDFKTS